MLGEVTRGQVMKGDGADLEGVAWERHAPPFVHYNFPPLNPEDRGGFRSQQITCFLPKNGFLF